MCVAEALDLMHLARDHRAFGVVDLRAFARDDYPIAVFKIADIVGEGRERDGVGADIHRAFAIAERQRRAFARADQQIVLAGEQEGERERAAQPRQRPLDRLDRRGAAFHFLGDEMSDDLGIGLGREFGALAFQLAPQLGEILDDAVVHDRQLFGRVRMRVVLGRPAVRRPTGMADADRAGERLARQPRFQILQLSLRAPPREHAMLERRHARRIIAAIFEAPERIDQLRRGRLAADDSDDAAHPCECSPLTHCRGETSVNVNR